MPQNRLLPFAPGDVLVGATLLNSATDDHAGLGRILQFDAELREKAVLWVDDTTHLIYGLNLAPDGSLWAQDPWAWCTVIVAPDGQLLESRQFDAKPFAKVHFMPDGTLLFAELLVGDNQPVPLTTRHRALPGHKTRLGDGMLWRYTADGELVEVQEPECHGGISGSMGVTHSVLSGDASRLFYVSETGPRLMQFDLVNSRQLPDLRTAVDGDRTMMHFDLARTPDGVLLIAMGNRVDAMTEDGVLLRTYRLPGFGWAVIAAATNQRAYVANWFSGEVVRLELGNGSLSAATTIAPKCIAGMACVAVPDTIPAVL